MLLRLRADDQIAQLHALQATAELARINYDRDLKQYRAQAVSQATLDTDAATLKNDEAQVAAQQALVDQKILRAPFSGTLGIRAVDLGEYLQAGTTVVGLQSLDPMFADFYLPQQDLSRISVGQLVTATIDAYPGKTFPGRIMAINPAVDPNSRNVAGARRPSQPRPSAAPGHVRHPRDRIGRAGAAHHAAADRGRLQFLRRFGLRRGPQGGGEGRSRASSPRRRS